MGASVLGHSSVMVAAIAAITVPLAASHVTRGHLVASANEKRGQSSCSEFEQDGDPWPLLTGPHMECGAGTTPLSEVQCGRIECQHLAEAADAEVYVFMDGLCRVCYDGNITQTNQPSFVFRRPAAEGAAHAIMARYSNQGKDLEAVHHAGIANMNLNSARKHRLIVRRIRAKVVGNTAADYLPTKEILQQRLVNFTSAVVRNPCQADILAMAPEHQLGLGSRINSLAEELMVAMYGNYTFAVCQEVNGMAFMRDSFLKFFDLSDQDFTLPVCTNPEACRPLSEEEDMMGIAQAGMQLSAALHAADRDYLWDFKQLIYPHLFRYKANTTEEVNQTLKRIGITNDTRYIGVHIRRGDKVTETKSVATEVYAAAAIAAAKGAAISLGKKKTNVQAMSKIYLATDDVTEVGKFMRAIRGEAEVIYQPPHANALYKSRDYANQENMFAVLSDIEALRRSEIFIGTASSHLGTLVSMLRGNMPSISLDKGGDWLRGAS